MSATDETTKDNRDNTRQTPPTYQTPGSGDHRSRVTVKANIDRLKRIIEYLEQKAEEDENSVVTRHTDVIFVAEDMGDTVDRIAYKDVDGDGEKETLREFSAMPSSTSGVPGSGARVYADGPNSHQTQRRIRENGGKA